MAMHVPRQALGSLDSPRLQSLSNMKNRQNGIQIFQDPESPPKSAVLKASTKRRYEPTEFDDEIDSENIDPSLFASPTKRAKNSDGFSFQKPVSKFSLVDATPSSTSSTPSAPSARPMLTPTSRMTPKVIGSAPLASKLTPAGRSPPQNKRMGILRGRTSTPFKRIDPPRFNNRHSTGSGLPFSIDAALSGTITRSAPKPVSRPVEVVEPVVPAPVIDEPMPKGWFFEIHEDTPEDEMSNLMEHSTQILDISSDEESEQKLMDERGKENVPPEDWVVAGAASVVGSRRDAVDRKNKKASRKNKVLDICVMKDAEDTAAVNEPEEVRSPLGDLVTEDFYPEGLDATSVEVVKPEVDAEGEEKPAEAFDFAEMAKAEAEAALVTAAVEKGLGEKRKRRGSDAGEADEP